MSRFKKYRSYFKFKLLMICCFSIIISCGILDEEDDSFNGTMQAKVNDELISFDDVYGDRILGDDMTWSGITKLVGKTDITVSGDEIQIDFPFNPAEGSTYHPHCMYRTWVGKYYDYNQTAYITKATNSEYTEFKSSVTFTSITDKSYEGTFSFMAYIVDENLKDSIVVKDGKFEIAASGKKW